MDAGPAPEGVAAVRNTPTSAISLPVNWKEESPLLVRARLVPGAPVNPFPPSGPTKLHPAITQAATAPVTLPIVSTLPGAKPVTAIGSIPSGSFVAASPEEKISEVEGITTPFTFRT